MVRAGLSNELKISVIALLDQKLWLKEILHNSWHTLYIAEHLREFQYQTFKSKLMKMDFMKRFEFLNYDPNLKDGKTKQSKAAYFREPFARSRRDRFTIANCARSI